MPTSRLLPRCAMGPPWSPLPCSQSSEIPAQLSDLISHYFAHHSPQSGYPGTFVLFRQGKLRTPGHLYLLFSPLGTFHSRPSFPLLFLLVTSAFPRGMLREPF